jgi:uncharacterized membrane protein
MRKKLTKKERKKLRKLTKEERRELLETAMEFFGRQFDIKKTIQQLCADLKEVKEVIRSVEQA